MQGAPVGEQASTPRKRQSWTPPRRTIGTIGLCVAVVGACLFLGLVGRHGIDGTVTAGHIAAGILILSGLHIGRWGFESQAAVNRDEIRRDDLADMAIRQEKAARRVAALQQRLLSQLGHIGASLSESRLQKLVIEAVRKAYAQGAVDMMDGLADVIPMSPNGVRVMPTRDPRR